MFSVKALDTELVNWIENLTQIKEIQNPTFDLNRIIGNIQYEPDVRHNI